MEIKELDNKEILDNFVGSQNMSQFLQSWEWGEFQISLNKQIKRWGLYCDGKLIGAATAIQNKLNYWYIPRGPIVSDQLHPDNYQKAWSFFIKEIARDLKKTNSIFLKIEPPLERHQHDKFQEIINKYKYTREKFVQPQDSWYLKLNQTTDEILDGMHQKTRYNIRLAEKRGVTVRVGNTEEDFEKFWQLCEVTSGRDKFKSHEKDYYRAIFEKLGPSFFTKIYMAEFEGHPLAANMVYDFGDTSTYVHGASSNENRNLMAPHLLQWRQIQDAKQSGFKYYDFWGVAPNDDAKHRWAGITRFKKGFGGQGINYLGVYDLILNNFWYKIYKIVKKIKK